VKAFLAVVTGMAAIVFILFIAHDHDNLFVAAKAAHALAIDSHHRQANEGEGMFGCD
jgi:hypothetical protein